MDEIKSNELELNSKNNSSLKRIGNFIKEARISRTQSVEELATHLKIGAHQLKATEKVFIKAMVRRISEKLKIDTEFIMSEFEADRKEIQVEEIVKKVSNKAKQKKSTKNKNSKGFMVFILISGTLGLLASFLIFNILSNSSQNQMPKIEFLMKKLNNF